MKEERQSSLNLAEYAALVAWGILLIVVCLRAGLRPEDRSVYPAYMRAAENWLHGNALYAGTVEAGPIDFRYSPPVAAMFVPLALLPHSIGAVLWRLVSAGAFLTAMGWWTKTILPADIGRDRRAILMLLILPLAAPSLNNGQMNPLLLALILGATCAVSRKFWTLACVFLVIAAALKVYPGFLAVLLVLLFPRQMGLRLVLASIFCFGASFMLRNPDYVLQRYAEWIHALRTDNRTSWSINQVPTDFRLLLRLWFIEPSPLIYAMIQAAAAAAVGAVCWMLQRRELPLREILLRLTGLCCCWMILFGPATEGSTFMLLGPTAAWAALANPPVNETRGFKAVRWAWLMAVCGYWTLVASQIVGWFPIGRDIQTGGVAPMGALLVFVALVVESVSLMQRKKSTRFDSVDPRPAPVM